MEGGLEMNVDHRSIDYDPREESKTTNIYTNTSKMNEHNMMIQS